MTMLFLSIGKAHAHIVGAFEKLADFGPAHQNVEVPVVGRVLLNVDNDDKFL